MKRKGWRARERRISLGSKLSLGLLVLVAITVLLSSGLKENLGFSSTTSSQGFFSFFGGDKITGADTIVIQQGDCVNLSDESTWTGKIGNSSDQFYINANVTLCKDTYNYSGTVMGQHTFIFNASNVHLDCNWSRLIGNASGDSYGINFPGSYVNNSLFNCNISDYNWLLQPNGPTGAVIRDNNFIVQNQGISGGLVSSVIINNTFSDGGYGIFDYIGNFVGTNVTNNVFNNTGIYLYCDGATCENSTISNNTISDVILRNVTGGVDLVDNNFVASGTAVELVGVTANCEFINNTFADTYTLAIDDGSSGNNTLTYQNVNGGVEWTLSNLTTSGGMGFAQGIEVNSNLIEVNSSKFPNLNDTAALVFNGIIGLTNLVPYRNGVLCNESICTNVTDLGGNIYTFNVTQFTNYSISGNTAPVVNSVVLSSSGGNNYSTENLSAAVTADDPEGDNISLIYDWKVEDQGLLLLQMVFAGGSNSTYTREYVEGNNASVSGATFSEGTGTNGTGMYNFNGSDGQKINVSDNAVYNTSEFSIEVRAMVNEVLATTNAFPPALAGFYDAAGAGFGLFALNESDGGLVALLVSNGTGSGDEPVTFTSFNVQGTGWHHYVATFNGTNMSIYVDGHLNGSDTFAGTYVGSNTGLFIGQFASGHHTLNGSVDYVRYWNRTLSAEQIAALSENQTDLIVAAETAAGDNWSVCVVPNDGDLDGNESCSGNLTVLETPVNQKPVVGKVVINSSSGNNYTADNLTAIVSGVSDGDGDNVSLIFDWRLEGSSVALLNLPFEGGSQNGTVNGLANAAKDYSTTRNNVTVFGASYSGTAGYNGTGAYLFNGSNQTIVNAANQTYNRTAENELTIEVWAQINNIPNGGATTFPAGLANFYDGIGGYSLLIDGNMNITFLVANGSGFPDDAVVKSTMAVDTGWHHYAAVFNGTKLLLYIDGVLNNSAAFSGTFQHGTNGLGIGELEDGHERLNGTVDSVRLWGPALSAQQVLALYNNRTNLIVSQETEIGDNWSVCVTGNDGAQDGDPTCASNVTIQSYYVGCVNLSDSSKFTENISYLHNATDGRLITSGSVTLCGGAYDVSAGGGTKIRINGSGTFDCNGSTLYGPGNSGRAIKLLTGGVLVKDCMITNVTTGIWSEDSNLENVTVRNNTIFNLRGSGDNSLAIFFNNYNFSNILIEDNNLTNILTTAVESSVYGIAVVADPRQNNVTIRNNTLNNLSCSGVNCTTSGIVVGAMSSTNVSIQENVLREINSSNANSATGIRVLGTGVVIDDNLIAGGQTGIETFFSGYGSVDVNVTNNKISSMNTSGIVLGSSGGNNYVYDNVVNFSKGGINLGGGGVVTASNFTIYDNIVRNATADAGVSAYGLALLIAENNTITNNTLAGREAGIVILSNTKNNVMINNNITGVNYSILDDGGANNTLIYDNDLGRINWSRKSNLTSVETNLTLGNNPVIMNNSIVYDADAADGLNSSAVLTMSGVNYESAGAYDVYKDGVICLSPECNRTSGSPVQFVVSSFSNYTTREFCGGTLSGDVTLVRNYNCSEGVEIGANDTVLDCDGHLIIGLNRTMETIGVGVNGYSNVTIRNCTIINFTTGIKVLEGDFSKLLYNNVSALSNISGIATFGMRLINASGNNISHNHVHDVNCIDACGDVDEKDAEGISLSTNTNHSVIYDNIVENIYGRNTSDVEGIRVGQDFSESSTNYTVMNNRVENITSDNGAAIGILPNGPDGVRILNNNVSGVSSGDTSLLVGIIFAGTDGNVSGNRIVDTYAGLRLGFPSLNAENILAEDNIVINQTFGLYVYASDDTVVRRAKVSNCTTDVVYYNLTNNTLENSYVGEDIVFATSNLTVTNLTVRNNEGSIFYPGMELNDTEQYNTTTHLVIRNESIYVNSSNLLDFNRSATIKYFDLGFDNQPFLFEDGVQCYAPECNNTWNGSVGLFNSDIPSFSNYTIAGGEICGGELTQSVVLETDYNCSGNGTKIVTDNITLDCRGHKIIGYNLTELTYGVWANNTQNLTVINCTIINFTKAIYVLNANKTTLLYNNVSAYSVATLNSSANGMKVEGDYTNISHNYVANVFTDGPDNDSLAKGIAVNGYNITVEDNDIGQVRAAAYNVAAGIFNRGGAGQRILRNRIYNISSPDAPAGIFSQSVGAYLEGNNITLSSGTGAGYGIGITEVMNSTVINSTIINFSTGVYLQDANGTVLRDNEIIAYTGSDRGATGIHLKNISDVEIIGNNISRVHCDDCGGTAIGIAGDDANNNDIVNNTISKVEVETSGELALGILFCYGAVCSNNYIAGNLIDNVSRYDMNKLVVGIGAMGPGNVIENNEVRKIGVDGTGFGMGMLLVSGPINLTNNTIDDVFAGYYLWYEDDGGNPLRATNVLIENDSVVNAQVGVFTEWLTNVTFNNVNLTTNKSQGGPVSAAFYVQNGTGLVVNNSFTGLGYFLENTNMTGDNVLISNENGSVWFDYFEINDSYVHNTTGNFEVSNNLVDLNSTALPGWNVPANLTFNNVNVTGLSNPAPLRNGGVCGAYCGAMTNISDTYYFTVTQFTNYSVGEGQIVYNITTWIDGALNDTFGETGDLYVLRIQVNDTNGVVENVSVGFSERNGRNPGAPLLSETQPAYARSVKITNSSGEVSFVVVPTRYAITDAYGYNLSVVVLNGDTITQEEELHLGFYDSLTVNAGKSLPNLAELASNYNNIKLVVATLKNSIENSEGMVHDITVYTNGSHSTLGTVWPGIINIFNVTLRNHTDESVLSGKIFPVEREGWLMSALEKPSSTVNTSNRLGNFSLSTGGIANYIQSEAVNSSELFYMMPMNYAFTNDSNFTIIARFNDSTSVTLGFNVSDSLNYAGESSISSALQQSLSNNYNNIKLVLSNIKGGLE